MKVPKSPAACCGDLYFARELKKLTSKRDKTDADLAELAHVEWLGSLYLHEGAPCLPGELLEAVLLEAARKRRKGKQVAAGVYCDGNFPLQYDGPQSLEALWEDERFRFTTGVRVKQNRTMRTRPRFDGWAAAVGVTYNDELVNPADMTDLFTLAGEQIGLGDWRPKFGRFLVEPQ
jgi:hypothetical protein